ncbi:replication factor A protein 3 [Macrolepiota fuliginosa MF-IS2]|uniref:Replication factor A protein 3 n=1 Tax=Macrolepiota fuliginosa MF-IS2 TaxID=1400762 RepID=A0A9P5X515_9AGAR|nr:replication factor A protein 3 [Macrolepiota fuliginosa MF-IS2]
MAEYLSPRVNSARLPNFVGKTVRLPCKVVSFNGPNAIVEASDGGQTTIVLSAGSDIQDTFVEVVGTVVDSTTIKMMVGVNMGDKLDLKLVNDTIEMMHDPRFQKIFFA